MLVSIKITKTRRRRDDLVRITNEIGKKNEKKLPFVSEAKRLHVQTFSYEKLILIN